MKRASERRSDGVGPGEPSQKHTVPRTAATLLQFTPTYTAIG